MVGVAGVRQDVAEREAVSGHGRQHGGEGGDEIAAAGLRACWEGNMMIVSAPVVQDMPGGLRHWPMTDLHPIQRHRIR